MVAAEKFAAWGKISFHIYYFLIFVIKFSLCFSLLKGLSVRIVLLRSAFVISHENWNGTDSKMGLGGGTRCSMCSEWTFF